MKNNQITKELIVNKIMELNELAKSNPIYNIILDMDYEWSQHKKLSIGEIQVTETITRASNHVSLIYRLYILGHTPQGISHEEIKELWGILENLRLINKNKSNNNKMFEYLTNN